MKRTSAVDFTEIAQHEAGDIYRRQRHDSCFDERKPGHRMPPVWPLFTACVGMPIIRCMMFFVFNRATVFPLI